MATKDRVSYNNAIASIAPISTSASITTTGAVSADLAGYEGCTVVVATGVHTIVGQIHMTESDDNSTFTAVAAADLIAGTQAIVDAATILGVGYTIAATDDGLAFTFGYRGSKRYVRAQLTLASGSGLISVIILRGAPRNAPVS